MSTLFVNNLNTASGSTLTVPTGKKLVVTDAGGVQVPHMIGQMVQSGTIAGHSNSASATWADTNYTLAITPTATSSKVLVLANMQVGGSNASDGLPILALARARVVT